MCGIVGAIAPPRYRGTALQGAGRLLHRGPDAQGSVSIDLPWARVVLGAARLAIVDPHPASMPSVYPRLGVALAYNGEVFNWRDLRAELSDSAFPWETVGDTEVVARAWRKWGPDMLPRLNGMFALALVDLRDGCVMLARDRAGEKPLYYAVDRAQRLLHFASEIKALPIELHEQACPEIDLFEFDCLERTPWEGVHRFPPGHRFVADGPDDAADPRPVPWWTLPEPTDDPAPLLARQQDAAVDQLADLIADAVRIRTEGVDATLLVSGGLDSAIVHRLADCRRVYCVTFDVPGYDTLAEARLAAPDAEIVPITFSAEEAATELPRIAYHLDTPATWTALAQYFAARAMAHDGYRVVLSGEGADELFCGYTRYRALWWLGLTRRDPHLACYQPTIDHLVAGDDRRLVARMLDRSAGGACLPDALALIDRFAPRAADAVTALSRVEWHTTMQVLLRMADHMTAAWSVENRSPFLDWRVIELACRTPLSRKITPRWSKAILREVALRLGVDPRIVAATTKRGFAVPWNVWHAPDAARFERGAFDRSGFAAAMREAWRAAFRDRGAAHVFGPPLAATA